MKNVVGVDIGGTFIRMGLVNENLEVFEATKFSVQTLLQNQDISGFVKYLCDYVDKYRLVYPIIGIQMGFPGTVDQINKRVLSVPNRHEFEGGSYIQEIEAYLQIPVLIEKDVNHLLAFDLKSNQLERTENALGFYIGTGFGNSMKLMGQYYRGENGLSGEIGHIPVYGVKQVCGCGNIGCLETVASGRRLVEIVKEYYPNIQIDDIFTIASSDPVIKQFIEAIAMAIATEINLLDIAVILLGGGVIAMKDFPKEQLRQYLLEKIRSQTIKDKLKIIYSIPNNNNGIIGAALLAFPILIGEKK